MKAIEKQIYEDELNKINPKSEINRLIKYLESVEKINRTFIIEALLTIQEKI